MIALESVNKWFGDHQVLRDCTLTISNGEVVVICGPSGSGKSTLIKCINGLEPVQSGSIRVDGEPVIQSSAVLLRLRRKVSMVFQSFELYPHMKVIDNVTLAPVVALRHDKIEAVQKAKALLAKVGMAAYAERWPGSLSGGQQQRVAIARALVMSPSLLLADEPTGNLDAATGAQVLQLIHDLNDDGLTVVLVTHDPAVAAQADRRITLANGRIA
jgi:glutamate/aspartate transport system ATP-binding protein